VGEKQGKEKGFGGLRHWSEGFRTEGHSGSRRGGWSLRGRALGAFAVWLRGKMAEKQGNPVTS
jgi:hypothetical protein